MKLLDFSLEDIRNALLAPSAFGSGNSVFLSQMLVALFIEYIKHLQVLQAWIHDGNRV